MRKKDNIAGFTFVEMAAVLSIISILAALSIPSFFRIIGRHKLQTAAVLIAEDIREIQQRNISEESTEYHLKFDCINDKYYLCRTTNSYRIVGLPSGIDLVGTNFGSQCLEFNLKGAPRPYGGHLGLRDNQSGKYLFVIIASITGRVRIDTSEPEKDETDNAAKLREK